MEKVLQNKEVFTIDPNEKTICILQLTRIGDLIQTLQSVRNLRDQFPRMNLKLVARKSFAMPMLDILKELFNEVHLLSLSDIINPSSLTDTTTNISRLVKNINTSHNDLLVNLSFSKPSGYLASLINADHKMGINRDSLAEQQIPDKWSQFIFSNIMTGDQNPFALVDIFNNIFGVKNYSTAPSTVNYNSKTVTIHPFSSSDKKNWNTNKWSEIIYKLLKNSDDIEINIIGSKAERNIATALCNTPILKSFTHRLNNYVGTTTITESLDIIKQSRLFIGHDSMASHLASLAQRTSLIIALGTVRPHETSPYSEGNYILVPKSSCFPCTPDTLCQFKQCHADIPYQLVYSMAHTLFKTGEIDSSVLEKDNSIFHLNSVLIYKTYFNEHAMLKFDNLLQSRSSIKEVMRQLYRITWLFYLSGKEEKNSFIDLTAESANELSKIMSNLQHLYELSEFGQKYSRYILEEISSETPQLQKIKEFSQKIDEIEELSKLVLKTAPLLSPFIHYFSTVRGNLNGKNIVELTEQTFLSFSDTSVVISVIYELSEKTLAEYRLKTNKTVSSPVTEI